MPTPSLFPYFTKAAQEGDTLIVQSGLFEAEVSSPISVSVPPNSIAVEIINSILAEAGSSPIETSVSAPIMVEVAPNSIEAEVC